MPNFFEDNSDLHDTFRRLDLRSVVTFLEDGFLDSSGGPQNYEDAMDSYEQALVLLGDICANFIAPRSAEIDAEGAKLSDGSVKYASATEECRKVLSESGFMGVMLPREYGGSNLPVTVYMMMVEMVSRADASLMTLFGYQDVGELIARFGTQQQRESLLPGLASGEFIGSVVLSEPGAGSDLQSIRLSARQTGDGQWLLNGTKHFISNGCGDVLMVLARSEPNIGNMFGLSLFVCRRSERVRVTRLEEKMGLHGSPTCELLFDDAPAELIGQRKVGLTKYTLESLNQARFSVAAQALGIAEAAYEAALGYSKQRIQFNRPVYRFPAVSEMLVDMRIAIETSRVLLYEGAKWLDTRNQLQMTVENLADDDEQLPNLRDEYRSANKFVNLFSPMVKYVVTEKAIDTCYKAQQIFGGMGYMRETGIERLVRDVRITTIYEGTTQVQVSASLKHVLADILGQLFDRWLEKKRNSPLGELLDQALALRSLTNECIDAASSLDKQELERAARPLVDGYADLTAALLLLDQAENDKRKKMLAQEHIERSRRTALATLELLTSRRRLGATDIDEICSTG